MSNEKKNHSFLKMMFHISERNEQRREVSLKLLVKSVVSQKEKSKYGRAQLENLRSEVDRSKNLKLVDELKVLRQKAIDLKNEHHNQQIEQFKLINKAVRRDYKFELN